ncbi:MAG TPA: hypothetical protein VG407_03230 [Caulobacteraceae bacterium]|jgi:hypothetical protein|nr:hypothetical protein [Caulobacteraceae bacterium]
MTTDPPPVDDEIDEDDLPPSPPRPWTMKRWAIYLPGGLFLLPAIVLLVLLFTPAWRVRPADGAPRDLPNGFIWTPVERDHFLKLRAVSTPLYVRHLEAIQVPESGLGSISQHKISKTTLAGALASVMNVFKGKGGGDEADTASRDLAHSRQVIPTYADALNKYSMRQYAEAEDKARQAETRIQSARPSGLADTMRLNGEHIATDYLLGHIRLARGKIDDAVKYFTSARELASAQREIDGSPYAGAQALYDLDPRRSLISLSTADLWNDELNALMAEDEDKAWTAAQPLYARPDLVSRYPVLAATLQRIAAAQGDSAKATTIRPDWTAAGDSPTVAQAKLESTASLIAMGDPAAMADFRDDTPGGDAAQLQTWKKIAPLRNTVLSEVSQHHGHTADDLSLARGAAEQDFMRTWRAQYLGVIGNDLLKTGLREHKSDYLKLAGVSDLFGPWTTYRARSRMMGIGPWFMPPLLLLLILAGVAFAAYTAFVMRVFRPSHHLARVAPVKSRSG